MWYTPGHGEPLPAKLVDMVAKRAAGCVRLVEAGHGDLAIPRPKMQLAALSGRPSTDLGPAGTGKVAPRDPTRSEPPSL